MNEFTLEDVKYVKLLDKKRFYYVDQNGETLRHAKVIFKNDNLQNRLVKEWRYHDPTKEQDKCIEVLLGKIKNKWYPLVTTRKLNPQCILKYKSIYQSVPKSVLKKAVRYTDALSDEEKKQLQNVIDNIKSIVNRKIEKPFVVKSEKDLKGG